VKPDLYEMLQIHYRPLSVLMSLTDFADANLRGPAVHSHQRAQRVSRRIERHTLAGLEAVGRKVHDLPDLAFHRAGVRVLQQNLDYAIHVTVLSKVARRPVSKRGRPPRRPLERRPAHKQEA